jgi:hypothetical protein
VPFGERASGYNMMRKTPAKTAIFCDLVVEFEMLTLV